MSKLLFLGGIKHGQFMHVDSDRNRISVPIPQEVRWYSYTDPILDEPRIEIQEYYREKLYDSNTRKVKELFIISGLQPYQKDDLLHMYLLERFINEGS